jgi:hypothetical protein
MLGRGEGVGFHVGKEKDPGCSELPHGKSGSTMELSHSGNRHYKPAFLMHLGGAPTH